jgi:hypothetical protein
MDEKTLDEILRYGPFDRDLVHSWNEEMRKDYLELLAIDLANLGLDEFRRQTRLLGETYLLSFGKPILADRTLLEAWWSVTGGEPPPPPPLFVFQGPWIT